MSHFVGSRRQCAGPCHRPYALVVGVFPHFFLLPSFYVWRVVPHATFGFTAIIDSIMVAFGGISNLISWMSLVIAGFFSLPMKLAHILSFRRIARERQGVPFCGKTFTGLVIPVVELTIGMGRNRRTGAPFYAAPYFSICLDTTTSTLRVLIHSDLQLKWNELNDGSNSRRPASIRELPIQAPRRIAVLHTRPLFRRPFFRQCIIGVLWRTLKLFWLNIAQHTRTAIRGEMNVEARYIQLDVY
ncbi:hypothetical protein R3P38DRAFT_2813941 [Favolaschia claudopus]|uniref:Uncharacterized protein n=1 Tax=Favolaschia claudopus TaxID=2862362 RepID=A0AAV9Z472_9AGAR